jgi:hypothetical protein
MESTMGRFGKESAKGECIMKYTEENHVAKNTNKVGGSLAANTDPNTEMKSAMGILVKVSTMGKSNKMSAVGSSTRGPSW